MYDYASSSGEGEEGRDIVDGVVERDGMEKCADKEKVVVGLGELIAASKGTNRPPRGIYYPTIRDML